MMNSDGQMLGVVDEDNNVFGMEARAKIKSPASTGFFIY